MFVDDKKNKLFFNYIIRNMRKFILSIIVFTFLAAVANAQTVSLEINKTDNSQQKIALSNLKKLTFSGSNLVLNYYTGINENIAIADIRKLNFGLISGIDNIAEDKNAISVYPNPATSFIAIKNLSTQNNQVTIYSVSGIMVFNSTLQSETIDISALKKGIYLLKVNNQVLKFSKL